MREQREQNKQPDQEQTIGQGSQQSKPTDAEGRPKDKQQGEKETRKHEAERQPAEETSETRGP